MELKFIINIILAIIVAIICCVLMIWFIKTSWKTMYTKEKIIYIFVFLFGNMVGLMPLTSICKPEMLDDPIVCISFFLFGCILLYAHCYETARKKKLESDLLDEYLTEQKVEDKNEEINNENHEGYESSILSENLKNEFFVDTPLGKLHVYAKDKVIREKIAKGKTTDSYLKEIHIDLVEADGTRGNVLSTWYSYYPTGKFNEEGNELWNDYLGSLVQSGIFFYNDGDTDIVHKIRHETEEEYELNIKRKSTKEYKELVQSLFEKDS